MSDHLIVVDWGTTNFRAFLVERHGGQVIDEIASAQGVSALKSDEFAGYCDRMLAVWRQQDPHLPVYLAGMVGARRGWLESPQPPLPVTLQSLAGQMVAAPGLANGWILPGARLVEADGLCDVMRGEEVQVLGVQHLVHKQNYACCLPGTHSKWARVRNGQLTRFATAMTGELYQTVLAHTLPGQPADGKAPFDEHAFALGLARAASEGGVLHALFEARSRYLYAGLAPQEIGSFISGVLIGEEVQRMVSSWKELSLLYVVGSNTLALPYRLALESHGISVEFITARDATLAGVIAMAESDR